MYDIQKILQTLTTPKTTQLLITEYLSVSIFLKNHLQQLQVLKTTSKGKLALSKIYFALQKYKEASELFTECDDAFYTNRMQYRMMNLNYPLKIGNCNDSLGYLYENKRFLEMMKFKKNDLFYKLAMKNNELLEFFINHHNNKVEVEQPIKKNRSKDKNTDIKNEKKDKNLDNSFTFESLTKNEIFLFLSYYAKKNNLEKLFTIINSLKYPLSYQSAYFLFDNYPIYSRFLAPKFTNEITTILDGSFLQPFYLNFMVKNNKTDLFVYEFFGEDILISLIQGLSIYFAMLY